MPDGRPHPTADELLDAFITAWHAGEAPSAAAFAERADEADRDELAQLIAAFLELAPTVQPTEARSAELASDPLVERIAALETARWDGAGVVAAAQVEAVGPSEAVDPSVAGAGQGAVDAAPWGERLRGLRDAAGLSVADLAARFSERFRLSALDAETAPLTLAALEAGHRDATSVAARAARALEEILGATRGALAAGAAPAFGGPVLRGAIPEDPDERAKFTELLREVDEALAIEADVLDDDEPEALSELLGD